MAGSAQTLRMSSSFKLHTVNSLVVEWDFILPLKHVQYPCSMILIDRFSVPANFLGIAVESYEVKEVTLGEVEGRSGAVVHFPLFYP